MYESLVDRAEDGFLPVDDMLGADLLAASRSAKGELEKLLGETDSLNTPHVLVVDDDEEVGRVVGLHLAKRGFRTTVARSADAAWEAMNRSLPHAIVTDVRMPGTNGIEFLTQATYRHPDLVVVVVSGVPDVQMIIEALRAGAIDFLVKPINYDALGDALNRGLERRRARLKQLRYRVNLEKMILERTSRLLDSTSELEKRSRQISMAYRDVVVRLGRASQWRDDETGEHIQRIGIFSAEVAREMGLSKEDVELIAEASPMHDIGKIGVPDAILMKPGRLTPMEFEVMKQHTLIGAELLSGSEDPLLKASEEIAVSHHEWHNGAGYPFGLRSDKIPLFGRIVAVVDVYDALTHDRSYKKAVPLDETISTMCARRGSQFDPEVFDCFLGVVNEFARIEKALSERLRPKNKYNVEIGLMKMNHFFSVDW